MSGLWFDINQRSSIPIYLQLVQGVKEAVAKGLLSAGDKMPSVRELAAKITINPNTIAKAYQEMEREGIIETLRGRGTFVAAGEKLFDLKEKRKMVAGMMEKILVEAFYLKINEEEMIALMEDTVHKWYRERRGK